MTEFASFILSEGRLPTFDDGDSPHLKQGWLLYYVTLLHHVRAHGFPDRWGYLMNWNAHPDRDPGPIERVTYTEPFDTRCMAVKKNLGKCFDGLKRYRNDIPLFLRYLLWSFGHLPAFEGYDPEEMEHLYRTFRADLWLEVPSDYPSVLFHEFCNKKHTAWFPTPFSICHLMAGLVHGTNEDHRAKLAADPCIGTGRTMLVAANYCLRIYGNDIDLDMVYASYVNGFFYAPWMVAKTPPLGAWAKELPQGQFTLF